MRLVLLALGGLLLLSACAQALEQEPAEAPLASARARNHYARATSLQQALLERPTEALLDESGEELVLQLAHAQTCLAHRTNDPDLAVTTRTLLDSYLELHRQQGQQPSWRTRRKIKQAKQDIDDVREGRADAEFLGCEPVRVRYTRDRSEDIFRTSQGGCRTSTACRTVPGGVIR